MRGAAAFEGRPQCVQFGESGSNPTTFSELNALPAGPAFFRCPIGAPQHSAGGQGAAAGCGIGYGQSNRASSYPLIWRTVPISIPGCFVPGARGWRIAYSLFLRSRSGLSVGIGDSLLDALGLLPARRSFGGWLRDGWVFVFGRGDVLLSGNGFSAFVRLLLAVLCHGCLLGGGCAIIAGSRAFAVP